MPLFISRLNEGPFSMETLLMMLGVDVVAVICARVAAPDGNRLLGAVDGNGDASLPLHAAYIWVQRAAVARVAAVHARHTA